MKACLAVFLLCMLLRESACGPAPVLGIIPSVATDVVVPVMSNKVALQMPYCYFEGASTACSNETNCEVWLVSSLTSATSVFDNSTTFQAPYIGAYGPTGRNFSTVRINTLDKINCTAVKPYNYLIGTEDPCTDTFCNGLLPEGQNMSFKYILVNNNNVVAQTNWSKSIPLRSVKNLETLGSGYAGRSAAMVVITTILSVAAALLLLLLLIALIMVCCYRKQTPNSYDTRHKPSLMGSLRIPSYDVHHLKQPSPYDNPIYEQNLKKRYTTTSTLPQTTTTVITHVQSNSPEKVIVPKM